MREAVEAGLAVVRPDTAGTDAAEGQIGNAELDHRVIDRDAAGPGALDDPLGGRARRSVKRYRASGCGRAVDEGDGLVDVVDGDDRQDRTEDLLGHHGRCGIDPGEHGRGEVSGAAVAAAARDHGLVAAGFEQADRAGRSAGR